MCIVKDKLSLLRRLLAAALFALFSVSPAHALSNQELAEIARFWPDTDFGISSPEIDWDDVKWGGVPKDGIPSIDAPVFAPVGAVEDVDDREPVVGVVIDGDARAYPLRMLTRHEIVNDVVAGVPVAVTFCPLCNTAVVFDRRLGGRVLEFGVSGFLRNSDMIMYDRQTESWWQQFVGNAIVGEMVGSRLSMLPARLESFAAFKARAPEGRVLVPGPGTYAEYGRNPYVGYDSRAQPYAFYDGPLPAGVRALSRVVSVGEEAWSLDLVRERQRIEIGDLVITWEAGQASALDTAVIAQGAEVGNVVVQRRTVNGYEDVVYRVDFAFAFHAFYPSAPIHVD